MNLRFLPALFSLLLLGIAIQGSAQNGDTEFGKNRIQYHDDFSSWLQYETPNFITYWYGKARHVGQAAVQLAEMDHDAIQNTLEHRINDKIELIVYSDLTDLKQSNIGSEDVFINAIGQTKIVGNKVFIFFNGDHNHLRQQIRQGIASVYLNAMLFGSNLQEIVQNAVMMNLPSWFKEGLVSFVGDEWNSELDNLLKDAILEEEFEDFATLLECNPGLAGHSLWYYLSQNYGKSTVSNLLYLTRINRSIESGFLYVLGNSYERTLVEWQDFYYSRYKLDSERRQDILGTEINLKNRRNIPITQIKLSPDGSHLAYVNNEIGMYKVYLYDITTGEKEMILRGNFRNPFQETDYGYPLLAWKPNGQELSILYETRDIAKFSNYDIFTKETITEDLDPQYVRVLSMDYFNNSELVFAAIVDGYSDLFIYQSLNRQTKRLTQDYYDDVEASVVTLNNKKGILFSSNRQSNILDKVKLDTILPIDNMDIYYYDLEKNDRELVRVTNTPLANESNASGVDDKWFTFLSDENGINNTKSGYLEVYLAYNERHIELKDGSEMVIHEDSTLVDIQDSLIVSDILKPVMKWRSINHYNTDLNRSIQLQDISASNNLMAQMVIKDGDYKVYTQTYEPSVKSTPQNTLFIQQKKGEITNVSQEDDVIDPLLKQEQNDTTEVDIDNYMFQSEFEDDAPVPTVDVDDDTGEINLKSTTVKEEKEETQKVMRFRPSRITPYRVKFRTDFVTLQLDNDLLFDGLETFAGLGNQYSYQPPGILLKTNFKDLFEDYVFEAGVRIPTTFNGAEYYIVADNKKERLDKRYAAYRKVRRETDNSEVNTLKTEFITLLGLAEFRYPLDIFTSLRAKFTVRNDKVAELATDVNSLNTKNANQQRAGIRLEYVFDNTLDVSINIKNGTRYKVYGEVVKRFNLTYDESINFEAGDGFMTILGVDARHYQRLDKHSILAARFSAASSFGSEKMLYYLGGTNNWLFANFDQDIPIPTVSDYAYQTVATNMRGFSQNIRNGNSFALINTELRVPVFRYFSKRTLRSNFLRNFQFVGFFDLGTAWHGATPFSSDNPLNVVTIASPGNPVTVRVNYFRDPIVAGYGAGIRTVLFGYFIRLDYAWGIETGMTLDPKLYFSLGLDF